ncbi:ARC6/PARC6 family protein [Synechococcus sp. CS-1329]|uniref:ARC6/PARC6 family protein n=1 Tax=Synechococcus sp. CS-1329 TaxID=2847975 RepID=UPI00223AB914|nr:ARC6/PARC6 family protein [Synechococcus sp. CS-1329]MCT0218003.1 ARC6/PARC6 family protein [Synechococcus sp. CS-1329]
MELPIDHFRLLGVSPATDAQTVLRTLQHRLENAPDQGFTLEAIRARADLLEASADVLSDSQRRQAYEAQLMEIEQGSEGQGLAAGLDVAPAKDLGGLLLLLEAGLPLEAFEATIACLQPPQAPALGSGREADLCLLAALACRAAAAELQGQRKYEAAAQLLQQAIQNLQRMGQRPEQRLLLANDLRDLLPFRVLGLVSRPLTAPQDRAEGLELLEGLVKRRGGLEGEEDSSLSRDDFQAFIKQIRLFLTAQEQVDLFDRWARGGSAAAEFLACYALTASGFAQRKPERIAAAQSRLQASGQPGIQPMLACHHLLLGQIEPAVEHFNSGAGPELKAWAEAQTGDPLAQLCAYCRDWLARDVLPGYRDIEVDADLETYFADRDVQAYVGQQDRRQARTHMAEPISLEQAAAAWAMPELEPLAPVASSEELSPPVAEPPSDVVGKELRPRSAAARPLAMAGIALATVAALVAGLAFLLRPRPEAPPPALPPAAGQAPATGQAPADPSPPAAAAATPVPLTSASPSQQEMRLLLERWLAAKAALLDGRSSQANLDQLARPALVADLRSEARALKARGEQQQIQARIQQFRLIDQSPRRIAADVQLDYSEERLSGERVIEPRTNAQLRNIYVFARDGGTWKLADFYRRR